MSDEKEYNPFADPLADIRDYIKDVDGSAYSVEDILAELRDPASAPAPVGDVDDTRSFVPAEPKGRPTATPMTKSTPRTEPAGEARPESEQQLPEEDAAPAPEGEREAGSQDDSFEIDLSDIYNQSGTIPPEPLEVEMPEFDPSIFDAPERPDGVPYRQKKKDHPRWAAQSENGTEEEAQEETAPIDDGGEKTVGFGGRLRGLWSRIQSRGAEYADNMYSEDQELDEDARIAEQYIPGTDREEESPAQPGRERKPRRRAVAEDISPEELSHVYVGGLREMSHRVVILGILTIVLAYLNIAGDVGLPLPFGLGSTPVILAGVLTWGLGLAILLSLDVIAMAFSGGPGMHTISALAAFVTILDSIWYIMIGRTGPLPMCALAAFSLWGALWGALNRKDGMCRASRAAASSARMWRVTCDKAKWNGRAAFTKERGIPEDFGSQLQSPDGAQKLFAVVSPLLIVASIVFALLSSLGRRNITMFLWSWSVILAATAPAGSLLAFGRPWLAITRRLDRSGSVLAGWEGVCTTARPAGILVTDTDLFPSGQVQFNGIKVYGDISLEKLSSCAASLIRESGSGLEELFDGLLQNQGGFYRQVENMCCYEAGGLSGVIRGEQVLVGSADFMTVMDIPLPQGLRVKNAVFCAIDGSLRGIFALNYMKNNRIQGDMNALLASRITPVLVTRDFNLTPAMLRQKLKLPVERMEYPPVERRVELTEPGQPHDLTLTALLSRDGLSGFSEAIVGGRRLIQVVRVNSLLVLISSVLGLLLSFYLTYVQSYTALSPLNLLAYAVLWLIPVVLVSGSVTRY